MTTESGPCDTGVTVEAAVAGKTGGATAAGVPLGIDGMGMGPGQRDR